MENYTRAVTETTIRIILQSFRQVWGLIITLWDATGNSEERKRTYIFVTILSLQTFSCIVLSKRPGYSNMTIYAILRERFSFKKLISPPASNTSM